MKRILALLLVFSAMPVFAACHAVSVAGAGTHSGADWNNSMVGLPGTLVRGDIYYLADGTYPSFTFNQSGTTTVEIRKAQSYDFGSSCGIGAGWNTGTMGSAQAVFATYRQLAINSPGLIINGNGQQTIPGCGGNVGSDPSVGPGTPTDCGIKIDNSACTSTSANACSDGISDGGVLSGGWTMEYVELLGAGNATSENYMIRADGSTGTSISHIYLHHYGSVCVVGNGTTNIVFNLNYLWRNQIVAGSSPAHGQCFEVGTNANGGTVSNNIFRDLGGTAAMATFNVSGTSDSWKFYNNVVWTTPGFTPLFGTTDGMVACINSHSCTNLNVSQNTFVNMGNNSSIENEVGGSATVQNNLWYTSGHIPTFGPSGTYTQDHNSFLVSGTSCASGIANVCDNASSNPFVSWTTGNFNLASDAADWNNRLSLTTPTTDINGATFTTDRGTAQFVSNTTWYVDPVNGGPRISGGNPGVASCNGQGTTPFNPSGAPNQSCPFQVARYLWNDPYTYADAHWVIAGGDIVEFRNADVTHPTEMSGSTGNFGDGCWGIGPYCSPPPLPSGTASQHTVLRGQNYAACSTVDSYGTTIMDPAKAAYLWAGGGTGQLLDLSTTQYADISCMQLRSHSSCNGINLSCSGTEWAGRALWTGSTATSGNITLTNMQLTGFQSRAIIGNIGGPWTLNNVELSFNGSAGWDLDPGFGSTRDSVNATVVMNNNIIQWNGCSRQWPDVNPIPVQALSCTYDTDGGYGDGIGTPPDVGILSWTLNHSRLAYNTQDAIDLGHLLSGTVIYTGNILFGNAGGAMKVGNATVLKEYNNFSEGNCTRMAQPITGAVSNYNAVISGQNPDLCRAGGDQNTFNYDPSLGHGLTADIQFNTFIGTGATVMDSQCFAGSCTGYTFNFSNNTVLGYVNGISTPTPPYPYNSGQAPGMFNNLAPTTQTKNLFFGLRSCPANGADISPTCAASPTFVSQPASPISAESALDNFNFFPNTGSPLIHAGTFNTSVPTDYYGVTRPNPPTVGAAEPSGTPPPTLVSIAVTPNPGTVTTTLAMTCTATYSDSSTGACVSPVWTDTNAHTSINSSTGVVTAISTGSDTISAAIGGISCATTSTCATVNASVPVATPTASPVPGTYAPTQFITLSDATPGASICFTTDGTTPTAPVAGTCSGGTTQTFSTAISVSVTTTTKALGTKAGSPNSSVFSGLWTIVDPIAATPTCAPPTGIYTSTQSVTCSSTTPSSTTYCTIDGSTPTTSSPVCTSISVASTLTLKAISAASGFTNSAVLTQNYTITPTPTPPTVTTTNVKLSGSVILQ